MLLVVGVVFMAACSSKSSEPLPVEPQVAAPQPSSSVIIPVEIPMVITDMSVNAADKTFEISIDSNPTTGYSWTLANSKDLKRISLKNMIVVNTVNDPQRAGAPGVQKFIFDINDKGAQTLRFEYLRPWEKNIPALQIRTYNVEIK